MILGGTKGGTDPVAREGRGAPRTVEAELAAQAVLAQDELLRAFQSAGDAGRARPAAELGGGDLEHVHAGLLAVVLRLVFVLLAEERGLMPRAGGFARDYSVSALFYKLQGDAARSVDALDGRHGAWSRLCELFRVVFDGATGGSVRLMAHKGHLFDPDAWPFLEGRQRGETRRAGTQIEIPAISDGAVYRVLQQLLVLDGKRLSYRALDVELLGSVYEHLLGFAIERASEATIGVLSPRPVPAGTLMLSRAGERRRSGSHYTPRDLAEPIVRATLRPILEALGPVPEPDAILDVKVCDPAMGSGAFLVETCRQLGDHLLRAWQRRGAPGDPNEEPMLAARQTVAQHCLYGVDENPLAVELAKLSLWLVTFARTQPFTFVDHALWTGDSLVGLEREQIASFDWHRTNRQTTIRSLIGPMLRRADDLRAELHALPVAGEAAARLELQRSADEAIEDVRLAGDCVLACFLGADTELEQRGLLATWQAKVESWLAGGGGKDDVSAFVAGILREGPRPVRCFHWDIELPEIFSASASATRRGFSAMVGNPPWVSYAGRAAQPLMPARRRYYLAFYRSFAGYRNLQGLFVERAARALRPGGRLGIVLPSSMAELDGYGPTRATHDRLAVCDAELPDLGERSFRGVVQPSMVLRSTVRARRLDAGDDAPWPIERPDLDSQARELLDRLDGPPLPPELFGERGLQTSGPDKSYFRESADAAHTVPLRSGSDIRAFYRGPPSLYADSAWFGGRLRASAEWQKVRLLIRQTARVPIAVVSDGVGFRNSILAGFESSMYSALFLVAYLNSTPIRWQHYYRHRDARLGLPQVKIGHLRAIPAPPSPDVHHVLTAFGEELCSRNDGIRDDEQRALDEAVARAFALGDAALARMRRDAKAWA